jgi:membrane associated rhomboid family serine protease
MARYSDAPSFALPRPGPALKGVLIGLLAIWLMFAVGLNWASVSSDVFLLLCGNTERILQGELWRLFTAGLVHLPSGNGAVGHIITALLGLYFLGTTLESKWGSGRFLRFLLLSAVIGYTLQFAVLALVPPSVGARLADTYWFGALPAIDAVAIAFALSFRGQIVRLFFIIPVSSFGLILFVVGANVMYLLAAAQRLEGIVSPFGGMLAGWLFGGSTPSPARKLWLKLQLARLDAEAKREGRARRQRAERSHLRVIEGGRNDEQPDSKRGPDGRWLN